MINIKNYSLIFVTVMAFFVLPNQGSAHNGSRDELGGHFRSADCVYLLHEPTVIAKSAANISELLTLIHQYNNHSDCAGVLSDDKVDLEGYTFPENGMAAPETNQAASRVPEAETPKGELQLGKAYKAVLKECTDGDTAVFTINGMEYKTRFLYIDTPESTRTKEPFGADAAQFTCSFLNQGNITLETDGGNLFDKYGRLLAWVWAGDKLHQEAITKAGLVEDFYDYGSYKYENTIWSAMDYAKENKKGIYGTLSEQSEGAQGPSDKQNKKSEEEQDSTTGEEEGENHPESKEKDKGESDQQPESREEPGPIESVEEKFECSFFSGLLFALLFYLTLPFKKAFGRRTLIAHRLWSNKWPLNLLLIILYAYLCYITLLLLILEILHFLKTKRAR